MMRRIILLLIFFSITADAGISALKNDKLMQELIFSWQTEEACKLLEKSREISLYSQGLYDFFTGNYKAAYDKFTKTDRPEAQYWLSILKGILPVTENFSTLNSEYFTFRFTGKDRILAEMLSGIMDSSVDKLSGIFGWKPENRVIVEIYPDRKSFQAASTLTDEHIKVSGAIGICKFNRIMISSPRILKFGYCWPDTAVHEYVHYVIGKLTGLRNMPLWLNEGLAKRYEEIWRKPVSGISPSANNFLYKTRKTGKWVDFEKMRTGMPNLETSDEVSLAFAQVRSVTDYMIKKYGEEKMAECLRRLKNETSETAFKKVFGQNAEEIKNSWEHDYIQTLKLEYITGAGAPSFAFSDDPVNAVSEWVSETAATDLKIADMFSERKKYELAEKKYIDALAKDPGNSVVLNRLARTRIRLGKVNEAEENYKKAVKTNPSFAPPYLHLADLFMKKNNLESAEEALMEYVYRSPFNPEAYKMLEEIYKKKKKYNSARKARNYLKILQEKI